jgi:Flp pilus assembly protein TadD
MLAVRSFGLPAVLVAVAALSGCAEDIAYKGQPASIVSPTDERPQDDPVMLGKLHYTKGDYGTAERYFQTAVEANPRSSEAWLGLAASYDRLRRFDLADRAYEHVVALVGRTAPVLNNMGYHDMLKGDLKEARALLLEAAQDDPSNKVVRGNLHLLKTWKSAPPAGETPLMYDRDAG